MTSVVLERLLPSARQAYASTGGLNRQRIYILPTRQGLIYSLLLITMLLGAVNYNNSMAYLLTFLLGSLVLVCILHTYRNLAGLVITGEAALPVFAGDTACFAIFIDNYNSRGRTALNLVLHPRGKLPRSLTVQTVTTDILQNKQQRVMLPVLTCKRGLLPLERVMISTCFPLGLFRAWSYLQLDCYCLVYPRPAGNLPLPLPVTTDQQGQAGIKTGTDDFIGFRHYHPGDSIRNIAWKALAREQPLLVKRFSGDSGYNLTLDWGDVAHLLEIEDRLSQLCAWVVAVDKLGIDYGLEIPGVSIQPGTGDKHKCRCLEVLAKFRITDAA
jgi:uncharacterized protein (DUF58 family)